MKKYESKFNRRRDKVVFPVLIRTIRECGTKFNRPTSIDNIIERCLCSRKKHSSETYFLNISWWPMDIGFVMTNYPALFISRLINIYTDKMIHDVKNINDFYDNFCQYVSHFSSKNETHVKEIYKALSTLCNENVLTKRDMIEAARKVFSKRYEYIDFSDIENYKTPYDR